MVHLVNIFLGIIFLTIFFGVNNIFINIIVSTLVYAIFMFGNISFFKLLFILLKSIPKTLLESFFIFFSKSEEVLFLDYKDDFDMLVKILSITLTPKTIAFDHDEKYLYIHKMGD